MKQLRFSALIVVVALLISSCGASATPTVNPADIQSTAVAAASTAIAQTQAAIPTATPIPPTDTPMPTPTVLPTNTPLPISELPTLAPTQAQSSGGTDCKAYLDMGGAGPGHTTVIKNQVKSVKTMSLTLQLYEQNAFGACGVMAASSNSTVSLPSGNWYAFAWITLKNGKNITSSGTFYVQPAQYDKLMLCIRESGIVYAPAC